MANLSIATDEGYIDKQTGDRVDKTEWHRVVTFQPGLVDMFEKHATKGRLVYVAGKLQTRRWKKDDEDSDRFSTEILLVPGGRVQFLDKPNGNGAPVVGSGRRRPPKRPSTTSRSERAFRFLSLPGPALRASALFLAARSETAPVRASRQRFARRFVLRRRPEAEAGRYRAFPVHPEEARYAAPIVPFRISRRRHRRRARRVRRGRLPALPAPGQKAGPVLGRRRSRRRSRPLGSFVRLHGPGVPGKWTDAATGEHGDLLDLVRYRSGAPTLRAALGRGPRLPRPAGSAGVGRGATTQQKRPAASGGVAAPSAAPMPRPTSTPADSRAAGSRHCASIPSFAIAKALPCAVFRRWSPP